VPIFGCNELRYGLREVSLEVKGNSPALFKEQRLLGEQVEDAVWIDADDPHKCDWWIRRYPCILEKKDLGD
jgi:hypothetical protein